MIWRDRLLRRLAVIVIGMAIIMPMLMSGLGRIDPLDPVGDLAAAFSPATDDPVLTSARLRHIAEGDNRGGGHLHGTGAPCKSEFPASWTRDTIATTIPQLAANDNLDWRPSSRNAYITANATSADGLKILIVVDPRSNEIVTAYPTNVARNPCPANDNRN